MMDRTGAAGRRKTKARMIVTDETTFSEKHECRCFGTCCIKLISTESGWSTIKSRATATAFEHMAPIMLFPQKLINSFPLNTV